MFNMLIFLWNSFFFHSDVCLLVSIKLFAVKKKRNYIHFFSLVVIVVVSFFVSAKMNHFEICEIQ